MNPAPRISETKAPCFMCEECARLHHFKFSPCPCGNSGPHEGYSEITLTVAPVPLDPPGADDTPDEAFVKWWKRKGYNSHEVTLGMGMAFRGGWSAKPEPRPDGAATRVPTHRCKVCGARWIDYGDSWSLFDQECGPCCDNAYMGDQIEPLVAPASSVAALAPPPHVGDRCPICKGVTGVWRSDSPEHKCYCPPPSSFIKNLWDAMPRDVQRKISLHDLKRIADNFPHPEPASAREWEVWEREGRLKGIDSMRPEVAERNGWRKTRVREVAKDQETKPDYSKLSDREAALKFIEIGEAHQKVAFTKPFTIGESDPKPEQAESEDPPRYFKHPKGNDLWRFNGNRGWYHDSDKPDGHWVPSAYTLKETEEMVPDGRVECTSAGQPLSATTEPAPEPLPEGVPPEWRYFYSEREPEVPWRLSSKGRWEKKNSWNGQWEHQPKLIETDANGVPLAEAVPLGTAQP